MEQIISLPMIVRPVISPVIEELFPNSKFKVEYYLTGDNQCPIMIEEKLITAYFNNHFELPPANHKMTKILYTE